MLNVCPTELHTHTDPALIYDGQGALKIIQSSVDGLPRDSVETHLYSSFRVYSDFSNFRFGFSSSFVPFLRPVDPPETETPDDAAHQGGKVQDTRSTGRQSRPSIRIGRAVPPDFDLYLGITGEAEAVGV